MITGSGQFTINSTAKWRYTFDGPEPGQWTAETEFDFPIVVPGLPYHEVQTSRVEQIGNTLVFEAGPLNPLVFGRASEDYSRLTCEIGGGCAELYVEDQTLIPLTRDTATVVPLPSMLLPLVLCLVALRRKY